MGFDVSYHPVDLPLIESRILPFLEGRGSIDDLVDRAVRFAKVRFLANAWGLGSRKNKRIVSDLHIWGRPYFITEETPDAVSTAIDGWLDATESDADVIARGMLQRLGIDGKARKEYQGELPSDKDLRQGFRWTLDLLRESYAAFKAGKSVVVAPDGQRHNPSVLLAREIPMRVLEFSANFRPGWMARGEVWPSVLLEKAGVPTAEYFEDPRLLMGPLFGELSSRLKLFLEPSIVENYMVGGWVRAERVPALRRLLEDKGEALVAAAGEDEGEHVGVCLRKIDEALYDAERRKLPFAEATEIYSGVGGIMN